MVQPWYRIESFGRRFGIRLVEWTSFGRGLEKAKKVWQRHSVSLLVCPSFATGLFLEVLQRALLGTRTRNEQGQAFPACWSTTAASQPQVKWSSASPHPV